MKKFLKVLINIFKVLFILFLCFIIAYTSFAASTRVVDNKFYLIPQNTNYGANPIWFEDSDTINEIYDNIGTIGAKQAAYNMYVSACKNLMLSQNYGLRSTANVSVYSPSLELSCDVIVNLIDNYHVVGTPELNANQSTENSNQQTIYMADVSDPALSGILKTVVQIANRKYSVNGNHYKQSGKLSAMDDGGEVITWATEHETEVVTERTYNDSDIKEKSNFIIDMNTLMDNATINREYDEEEEMYFYTIDFSLNCAGSGEEGSATYYEYNSIFKLLGENMKSLIYSKLNFQMTMYENGYFINWNQTEEWTVTYGFSILEATGTALSIKNEVFTYDPRDCGIVNFTL